MSMNQPLVAIELLGSAYANTSASSKAPLVTIEVPVSGSGWPAGMAANNTLSDTVQFEQNLAQQLENLLMMVEQNLAQQAGNNPISAWSSFQPSLYPNVSNGASAGSYYPPALQNSASQLQNIVNQLTQEITQQPYPWPNSNTGSPSFSCNPFSGLSGNMSGNAGGPSWDPSASFFCPPVGSNSNGGGMLEGVNPLCPTPAPPANVTDLLTQTSAFPTLASLIQNTGLSNTVNNLENQGPLLVLAPTEAAFQKLQQQNPALYQQLMLPQNADKLKQLLEYHISQPTPSTVNSNTRGNLCGCPSNYSTGDRTSTTTAFSFPDTNTSITPLTGQSGLTFTGNAYQGTLNNNGQVVTTGRALQLPDGSMVIPIDDVLIPPGFSLCNQPCHC